MICKPYFGKSTCLGVRMALVALLVLNATFAFASPRRPEPDKNETPLNGFDLALYESLSASQPGENIAFSPVSARMALAIANAGAAGDTRRQISAALTPGTAGPEADAKSGALQKELSELGEKHTFQLKIANRLWVQNGFPIQKAFIDLSESLFAASPGTVDFKDSEASRKEINQWIATQTADRIKELLQPGFSRDETRMIITNATYFKAWWQYRFKADTTQSTNFTLLSGAKVKAQMMSQEKAFDYAETKDWQFVDMPYSDGEVSMSVLLPRKASAFGKLETHITSQLLNGLIRKSRNVKVSLEFPKFKIAQSMDLVAPLKVSRITDAFDKDKADFSAITGKKDLFIDKAIQMTFVNVDEKGTEAAAATAIGMDMMTALHDPERPVEFHANHPFVYLIRAHRSGTILFMGRVTDPTK